MEDELIRIWQSSPKQERAKFEKSRLMIDVQSEMDQFHRKINYRDWLEQLCAALVVVVFAYYIYFVPFVLSKIASALISGWGVYVIFRLRKAKQHKPTAMTETYLDYLHKTREYLTIQKHLLDNLLYWYILPFLVFVSLFLAGMAETAQSSVLINGVVFNVLVAVSIYYVNKRAVKTQIMPRLKKVNELIETMELVG